LKGKVVVITGSESGIGKATTTLFLRKGARVIGLDRNNSNCFPNNHRYILKRIDLLDLDEIKRTFQQIKAEHDKIDLLINCAGITSLTPVMDITPEDWDHVMHINLRSMFFCSKYALKEMIEQQYGKIINIASNAGKAGGEIVGPHYSASKAGVISLTISLAQFAAKYNINVNCVAPGPTETSMTSTWDGASIDTLIKRIPLRRLGKPEEVAETIYFLASRKADFITGEIIDVNGGLLMD